MASIAKNPDNTVASTNVTDPNDGWANGGVACAVGDVSGSTATYNFTGAPFDLPDAASITGIQVDIKWGVTDNDDSLTVELLDVNAAWQLKAIGNRQVANCGATASDSVGADGDLWGGAFSRAHIESANFQVRWSNVSVAKAGDTYVDSVLVTVYYELASEELFAKFTTQAALSDGSAELLGKFEGQASAELLGRGEIQHTGTPVELLGKFIVRQAASEDLLGKFTLRQLTSDLSAKLRVSCPRLMGSNWQRKMWWDGTYYWRGRYDPVGDELIFEYIAAAGLVGNVWTKNAAASIDASGFSGPSACFTVRDGTGGIPFTIHYSDGVDTWVAESNEASATGWAWVNLTKVFDGTDPDWYRQPNLCADQQGAPKLWATAVFYDQSEGKQWVRARAQTASGDITGWDGAVDVSNVDNTATIYGESIRSMGAAAGVDVMVVYKEGAALRSRYYDGDWDDVIEDIDVATFAGKSQWDFEHGEAPKVGHVLYVDADNSVQWKERDAGAASVWSAAEEVGAQTSHTHRGVGIIEHGSGWLWVTWANQDNVEIEYRLHLCTPEMWMPPLVGDPLTFDATSDPPAVIETTTIAQLQTSDSQPAGSAVIITWIGETAPTTPCSPGWGIIIPPAHEDLLSKFEVGQDSADLIARFEAQASAELLGKAEVQQSGSAELLGKAVVRNVGSAELLGRFEAQASAELLGKAEIQQSGSAELLGKAVVRNVGSAELLGRFEAQASADLLGNAEIQQSGSAELLGRFESQATAELLGRFESQASAELLGKFEAQAIQSDSAELLGKTVVRNVGSAELLGRFEAQASAELLGNAEIQQSGSAELLGRFEGQASVELLGRFEAQASAELLGKAVIRHVGTPVELLGRFEGQASAELLGRFEAQASAELLGKAEVQQSGSTELLGKFEGQASAELLGKAVVRNVGSAELLGKFEAQAALSDSAELLGKAVIRNIGSAELLCTFEAQASAELLGRFEAQATAELLGKAVVRNIGSAELLGKAVVRNVESAELLGRFESQASAELLGNAEVQRSGSAELLADLIVGQSSSRELLSKFIIQSAASQDLSAKFEVGQDSADLYAKFEAQASADLFARGEVRNTDTQDLLAHCCVHINPIAQDLAQWVEYDSGAFLIHDCNQVDWSGLTREATDTSLTKTLLGPGSKIFHRLEANLYDVEETPNGATERVILWAGHLENIRHDFYGQNDFEIVALILHATTVADQYQLELREKGGNSSFMLTTWPTLQSRYIQIYKQGTNIKATVWQDSTYDKGALDDSCEITLSGDLDFDYVSVAMSYGQAGGETSTGYILNVVLGSFEDLLAKFETRSGGATELYAKLTVRNSDSEDLFARLLVGEEDSAELLCKTDIQQSSSAELIGRANIQQSGSAELLGRFEAQAIAELLGKAEIQQSGSAELLGRFEAQASAELLGKTEIQQSGSAELLGRFEAQASAELLGKTVVRNVGSAELLGRFESQASAELLGRFEAQASAELLGKAEIQQSGSAELLGRFEAQASAELLGKAEIQQSGSAELLGRFETQATAELLGKAVVRNIGSAELLGRFEAQTRVGSAELLGNVVVQQLGSAELLGKILIGQSASAELLGKAEIQQSGSAELLGKAIVKNIGSAELLGNAEIKQSDSAELIGRAEVQRSGSAELLGRFEAQASAELLGRFESQASAELLCTFEAQASIELLGKAIIGHSASAELLGNVEVQQSGSAELLGNVEVQQSGSAELLGRFEAQASAELLGKAEVQHSGSAELLGRAEIRQPASAELLGKFDVGQGSAELLGKAEVKNIGSADLPAIFWVRHPYRLWTNRRYLNGVVELTEILIGNAILEYVIEGVMQDIQSYLINAGLDYSGWTNIVITPKLIRRATTYGTVAALYARRAKTFATRVIPTIAPVALTAIGDEERAMNHWRDKMNQMLEFYVTSQGGDVMLTSTPDEEPVFSTEEIPPELSDFTPWYIWLMRRTQ